MNELNFGLGIETFSINGGVSVSFNPTDSHFIERLFAAFDALDERQSEYKARLEAITDNKEIFTAAREQDREMRELIDGVFGQSICGDVFSDMNVYAMSDGLPVWCNFMLAVIDTVDSTFAREQKATNPRIAKYTQKYKK